MTTPPRRLLNAEKRDERLMVALDQEMLTLVVRHLQVLRQVGP